MKLKKMAISMISAALLCTALSLAPAAPARAEETPFINIAEITLKPECREDFISALKEVMETAMRVEPGVIMLYAVVDKDDPNKLTGFDIYKDEAAFKAHCETPHFKKYIEATKDMAVSKSVKRAIAVELRDKHNTQQEK